MDSIRCKSNIHENIERTSFMSKELQIRNSTVDFLVFTRDAGEDGIEVRVQNGDIWLTQKAISKLFDVDRSVITKHLSNIFKEGELDENSVCAKFAQTADDGKTYNYKFYSLAAIAKEFAESEFEKYRVIQDSLYESDFDKLMNDMEKNDAIH
ncbi:Virulence protein [Roseburia inulinivorans]|uniref:Virulence protein n=2 Tax=Roseburia inulinivorans TaxID=360807 RepID=A0A173UUS0_9FIRM|nr:Virulence protein [Roseburia inulinivorans]